jgi:7-cyano-7-deazaguanine synthase
MTDSGVRGRPRNCALTEVSSRPVAENVVLLSGGLDSTTVVASLAHQGLPLRGLYIDYGQGARCEEQAASRAIATYYGIPLQEISLEGVCFGGGEIRGRNAFLLHLGLLALPPIPCVLMIGIHSGTTYVDCGPTFLELQQRSFDLHTAGEVQIAAPFIEMSKGEIFRLAQQLSVPLTLTYSCECGGEPCGQCLSCLDRAQADALA